MKIPSYINEMNSWVGSFKHSFPIKVRFSETDAFGHVNNTRVFIYFEEARIEFFKKIGLMEKWLTKDSDYIPVTADLQCDYIRQMYFDERLTVYVKVHSIGKTSVDLHYLIKNGKGNICATGRGRMVQVNKLTGKSVVWDEILLEKFQSSQITAMN